MEERSKLILERITKSRVELMLDFTFFGVLALSLKIKERDNIETMATDGVNLYYNVEFVESLSDEELNWVIVHEILHPALGHIWRKDNRLHEAWNIACDFALHDIMVKYTEENRRASQKLIMPKGCLYDPKYSNMSAEQIYDKFDIRELDGSGMGLLDDHDVWNEGNGSREEWEQKVVEASISARDAGNMPGALKRLLDGIVNPKKDWRIILNEFVEWEITDYSFSPPDRRFSDYDFFMPDFSEEDETIKNIVFLIDTSGSIQDKELNEFYSELVGAVNQFQKLEGKLGFFDHKCYGLTDFVDVTSLMNIKPVGGGGTSFINAFEYLNENTDEEDIAGIVVFTDGYAEFPEESMSRGVPVLWVICNDSEVEPPWGGHINLD